MRKLFVLCVLMLVPLAPGAAETSGVAELQAHALFEADWQWRMQNQPEFATMVGDYRFNASLSDSSLAGSRNAIAHQRAMLDQARMIERGQLTGQQLLSYELFVLEKEQFLKAASFYPYAIQPLTSYEGIHISFVQLVAQMPFATEADYRNYLARLDALPRHIDGVIEQLREGVRSGWIAPKAALRGVPDALRQLREQAVAGALGQPFRQIPAAIDKPVRDLLAASGPAILRLKVMPALQQLEDVVRHEVLPAAREAPGASSLPGGPAYYAFAAAVHTTVDMAPADIHALGLREVARIQGEMKEAIARTGFQGTFAQFIIFASTDPRLFYRSPERLLERYRRLLTRAGAALPTLFDTLPQEALLVKPAAALNGETQAAAYYEAAAPDRPAAFVVNTARMDTHPLWEMETLALHEGVPGHHLQVAQAHALTGLPSFRRHAWYAGFGEGWALYAESLGPELGFFKDPFSAFGHLNSQLFRAARLVADTGIHAQGWTRQQALDYLNANTANPAPDNEIEVDRIIGFPGRALAYTVGEQRIRALRTRAQAALGGRFDLRRFHGALLENGALPLPVLEQQMEQWVAVAQRKGKPSLQAVLTGGPLPHQGI